MFVCFPRAQRRHCCTCCRPLCYAFVGSLWEEIFNGPRGCFDHSTHQESVAEHSNAHRLLFRVSPLRVACVFPAHRVCLSAFDGVSFGSIVESAPFKLTAEFVDLMDGPNSACFKGFREVRERGISYFYPPPTPLCCRVFLLFIDLNSRCFVSAFSA